MNFSFRPLAATDLPLLCQWLGREHVACWWGGAPTLAQVQADYLPMIEPASSTRGYIALLDGEALGFIQSYVVMGSGDGWWEAETDPGARGIDQFLCDDARLGQGLGSAMIRGFVAMLFRDPSVTRVQTDPEPHNLRAIRAYRRAGFIEDAVVQTPDGPALLMHCPRSP